MSLYLFCLQPRLILYVCTTVYSSLHKSSLTEGLAQNQAEQGGNEGWMEGLRREIVDKEGGLYGGFRGLGA